MRRYLRFLAMVTAALFLSTAGASADTRGLTIKLKASEAITGKPRIIDGDTIEITNERIRLHGIDAPESKQTCAGPSKTIPCGRLATLALMDLTAGAEVTCKTNERDRYGRWIGLAGCALRKPETSVCPPKADVNQRPLGGPLIAISSPLEKTNEIPALRLSLAHFSTSRCR